MVGVRVHVGKKSLEKIPSFIEVLGRTKTVFLSGELRGSCGYILAGPQYRDFPRARVNQGA